MPPVVADYLDQPQYTEQEAQNNHGDTQVAYPSDIELEISIGTKVRIHCPGSVRNGKEAVVCGFISESGLKKAVVKVSGVEEKYRRFECFVPGTPSMRLELIST